MDDELDVSTTIPTVDPDVPNIEVDVPVDPEVDADVPVDPEVDADVPVDPVVEPVGDGEDIDPIEASGIGLTEVINGTPGNDRLTGVAGKTNFINLEAGNDIGTGAELDDLIEGDAGNDILIGAGNNGVANLEIEIDFLGEILDGDTGSDLITGGGLSPFPDGTVHDTLDITGATILAAGLDEDFDQIVLGGKSLDETPIIHYDEAGNDDFALVNNFVSGQDKLVVGGDIGSYSFGASPIDPLDTRNALFFNGELIAIIDNLGPVATASDLTNTIDLSPYQDILA